MEGPRPGDGQRMTAAADFASGKGSDDENFPVASRLIQARHRGIILAFYAFARAADDVADNAEAAPAEKLRVLEGMRATLLGKEASAKEAAELRRHLLERGLPATHGLDLLEAFRRDVTKKRYANFDELMDYCRYSAMPVGRFVLDVHGEPVGLWPQNDALCAALQVINHLQDCAKDYRELDRVYIPLDRLSAADVEVRELAGRSASAGLSSVLRGLAQETASLLDRARPFASLIRDPRLAMEVSVIQALAEDLNMRLMERDPLCDRVHHQKSELLGIAARAIARFGTRRVLSFGLFRALAGHS